MKKTDPNTQSRWRNIINYTVRKEDNETPSGRSITVPDESTDLKTILAKFTRGEIATLNDYPEDDGTAQFSDLDIEAFQRMELSEQADFLTDAKDTLDKFARAKNAAEKKKLEKINNAESEEDDLPEVSEKPRKTPKNEEKNKPRKQPKNEDLEP